MLISYTRGQGSVVLRVKILDSSVVTGAGKTGLSSSSSGLIISTIADNEASATVYTQAGSTIETITTLGTYAAPTATKCRFKEVDATNHKGVYEIQIADARYAVSSAKSLLISLSGVTNAAETDAVVPLLDINPYDSVRAGLTALPNAAAGASTGLPLSVDSSGRVDVLKINGTSQTARDIGASVLLSPGTGTGQILLSSGDVSVAGGSVTVTGTVTLDPIDSLNLDSGTAQAGSSSTITLRSGASSINNTYRGCTVIIYSGAGAGQARVIQSYTGSSKVATADESWVTNPDNTSLYRVLAPRVPQQDSTGSVKIQSPIKQNQGLIGQGFYMRLAAGGGPAIGLGSGVTVERNVNNAGWSTGALGSVSEEGKGFYYLTTASASDMNGTNVDFRCSAAGCVDTLFTLKPLP